MIKEVFGKIDEAGIKTGTKILCAISGGIDSTVMLHVLNDFGFDCIVAHCNFKLRGKESDGDEEFVRNLTEKMELKFLCETFDTTEYAAENGLSIQMAARDLRYEWFNNMAVKYNCSYIALAHNSDDQVETTITNLTRGTGVRGLTGMRFLKDNLFRPILFISRKQIEEFAQANNIDFRNDSTNTTVKYSRNKIRHQVIPLLEEINSSAKSSILRSVKFLTDTESILRTYVKECSYKCKSYEGDKLVIDIKELKNCTAPETVLFELLIGERIPKSLAADAINLIDAGSGKSCSFLNITILRDRNKLIIDKSSSSISNESILIAEDNLKAFENLGISAVIAEKHENMIINKSSNFAYIDCDKLKFPLVVRNWQHGDKFRPFGMQNFRKLSDFFTDEKLNMFEKESVKIIESDGKIVWIAGLRSDDRYRITSKTVKILILEMQ